MRAVRGLMAVRELWGSRLEVISIKRRDEGIEGCEKLWGLAARLKGAQHTSTLT